MTTDTLTLTAFLLARIEEDEAVASKQRIHDISTCPVVWHRRLGHIDHEWADCECGASRKIEEECAAKRAIVELHSVTYRMVDVPGYAGEPDYQEAESICRVCHWVPEGSGCATLRILAAVYADHPDYRAEWAL